MKNKLFFVTLMCGVLTVATYGQWWPGSSSLSIDPMSTPSSVNYNPFDSSTTKGLQFTFTVRLSKKQNYTTSFSAVIDGPWYDPSSRTVTSGSNTLTVGFYKDSTCSSSSETKSSSDYYPSYYISDSLPRNTNTKTITVYPALAAGQTAAPGTYTGSFTINLYSSSSPGYWTSDTETFTYTVTVDSIIDVKLGSSTSSYDSGSSSFDISLGELSTGPSASFGIFMRANTPYILTMTASNGGYLVSSTTSDQASYSVTIDGTTYSSLGSAITLDQQTSSSLYSKTLLGTISVPSGQDLSAGDYSGNISFSIASY